MSSHAIYPWRLPICFDIKLDIFVLCCIKTLFCFFFKSSRFRSALNPQEGHQHYDWLLHFNCRIHRWSFLAQVRNYHHRSGEIERHLSVTHFRILNYKKNQFSYIFFFLFSCHSRQTFQKLKKKNLWTNTNTLFWLFKCSLSRWGHFKTTELPLYTEASVSFIARISNKSLLCLY